LSEASKNIGNSGGVLAKSNVRSTIPQVKTTHPTAEMTKQRVDELAATLCTAAGAPRVYGLLSSAEMKLDMRHPATSMEQDYEKQTDVINQLKQLN
jgi:hypothetical protein